MRRYFLLAAFCGACYAQAVEGFVEDSLTGMPIAGAHVAFGTAPDDRYVLITDRAGHFWRVFAQPNCYDVVVIRPGYLPLDQPLSVTPGENSSDLHIRLVPQAVISGKLVDEDGFPVREASVQALSREPAKDGKAGRPAASATSNDRGEFRIAGLRAGGYYIRVTPSQARRWDRRYVPEYYPAGSLAPGEGSAIEVAAGQEAGNIAFAMRKYEGVTVTGHVVLPPGANVTQAMFPIYLGATDGSGFAAGSAFWQADTRSFTFRHVPPGTYTIHASSSGARRPSPGDLVLQQEVQVADADVTDLVATFHVADATGK